MLIRPLHSDTDAVQFSALATHSGKPRPGLTLSGLDSTQYEVLASCSVREPLAHFAHWMVQELGLPHRVRDGWCRVRIPEDRRHELGGHACLAFYVSDGTSHATGNERVFPAAQNDAYGEDPCLLDEEVTTRLLAADEPFLQWLCRELHATGPAAHTRPRRDPQSVYELSDRLFRQYRVDGGSVHLSGCALEDEPFLRLTYVSSETEDDVKQLFFTPDGAPADTETRDALGLIDLCRKAGSQSFASTSQVDLLVAAGKRLVRNLASATDSVELGVTGDLVLASVVWVKRAVGRLRFTIGDESVDLPFEGWARTLEAPPFICPHSGVPSFHLAATDDGRIASAEAIETCSESGRRVIADELVTCSVTGKRVLREYTRICPVSGEPALEDEFALCAQCQQWVSRIVLKSGVCSGCRSLAPSPSDDPRLVWLLGEYPRLEAWRKWKLSETSMLYIISGTKLSGHLLLVVDKETLAPRYAATRGRFRRTWYELDPTEQQELFAERALERPE